jgi:aminopeptidase 2
MSTSGFTKPEQLAKVEKFFEGRSTKGFDRNLAQTYDAVKAKIGWVQRDAEGVEKWLKENKYL